MEVSKNNMRETKVVPIIDASGEKIDEIKLMETIMPIPNKRGGFSKNGNYYKGAGIVYRNHLGCDKTIEQTKILGKVTPLIIGKTELVYENLIMCYPHLVGKFGIFTFRHQPVFSDYEGGCGKKEKKLLDNLKEFELSAIEEVIDVINTGLEDTNIYCYRLKNVKGNITDTKYLIRYILDNDWNTAWDKNLWEDIECFGYVRDVADWFKSDKFCHKLGTVYALLNSLYRVNKTMYARLLIDILGYYEFEKKKILYISSEIVKKYCKQFKDSEYDYDIKQQDWFEKLYMLLISGKACCHLEDDEGWNWVRKYFIKRKGRIQNDKTGRNIF